MTEPNDGIETLLDALIDGRCDEAGLRRFEVLLRDDPNARSAYLDQIRMHALLEWRNGCVEPALVPVAAQRGQTVARGWRRWRVAGVLLVGVGLAALALWAARRGPEATAVATLIETRDVVWAAGSAPIAVNARIGPRDIRCEMGTLKLAFDSGALVSLEGPADLKVLSGMRIRAVRGRITARVEEAAKGFTIETPNTEVVDQGTEFGVEVDASGQTGVVVFNGLVDLKRSEPAESPSPVKRLSQGEALRVGQAGRLSRIVSVERRSGEDVWSTEPSSDRDAVFRSVSDNIRGLKSSKYYQIVPGGLAEDARAYVDRPHQWNGLDASGLPDFLRGADYIQPFNDDTRLRLIRINVEVARAARLYIFFDNRAQIPSWLTECFTDTGVDIGLDEGWWPDQSPPSNKTTALGPGNSINSVFSVWKREVAQGQSIELGALDQDRRRAMYGIAAVAHP